MTKRITGNWLRKADSREVVAGVWPELERFLSEKGYSFAPIHISPSGRLQYELSHLIGKYDGCSVEEMENPDLRRISSERKKILGRMKKDLLESRSRFIGRINNFDYNEFSPDRSLDMVPIRMSADVRNLSLRYDTSDFKDYVCFEIMPARGIGSYDYYVGNMSTSKSREKSAKFVSEVMTDASNLVIEVSARAEIAKQIGEEYRRIRGGK